MNYSNDKEVDQRLDALLSSSVGPEASPFEFSAEGLPTRPRFGWTLIGGVALAVLLLTVLGFIGIHAWAASAMEEGAVNGSTPWRRLLEGVVVGAESLSSNTFLLYASAVMVAVYGYFASKIIRLYRLY